MIRKIKRRVHHFLLNIIDLVVSKKTSIQAKHLLIIRLDAIGDYVLFRNFIQAIKKSEQYKGYTITLIGNIAWKELAETLDSDFVDHFIWVNRHKFYKNYYYRFKKIRQISSVGYDVVLNPMYSREYYFSESIVHALTANEKISCTGDTSNMLKKDKQFADKLYSKLLLNEDKVMFEFYRNQECFERLLEKKLVVDLSIDSVKLPLINNLPDNFVVLFLGASRPYRKWSASNFAKVAEYLKETYQYDIIICGATTDDEQAKLFKDCFKYDFIDFVGKTSLVELLSIIRLSQLLISNETSAVHFAVGLNVDKIIVLYNGNHFGRFTPYPEGLHQGYHLICHPDIAKDKKNYQAVSHDNSYVNNLDINEITVDEVIKNCRNIASKTYS